MSRALDSETISFAGLFRLRKVTTDRHILADLNKIPGW